MAELSYDRKDFSRAQWEWCVYYLHHTTFEPLMCDFVDGKQTFHEAARLSIDWFESWSGEAHLRVTDLPLPRRKVKAGPQRGHKEG